MLRRYEAVEVSPPMESLLYMKSWRTVGIQKTEDGYFVTYFKYSRQVITLSIAVHVRLSEPEIAHRAEAYPERRIKNSELSSQPRKRVSFICRRPRRRKNVNVRVRYDPQATLCDSGHHAATPGSGTGTISILRVMVT